jgi:perosamine synthetase
MIKLFDPHITAKEIESVTSIIKSKFWASGSGINNVQKFEQQFLKYTNSKSCVAVNNGTSALFLALSLFNINKKEVLVPSLTFVSTVSSIIQNGGKPVFVDVDPTTLCIDPNDIQKKISKNTAAIIPVHFAGFPANLLKIKKIIKNSNIKIIEDAAHAAGTSYNDKMIGGFSDAVCFSFHPVKNLAMPTGGAICLNKKNYKKHENLLKSLRWCGIENRKGTSYDVKQLGWNFYMNEISASIGLIQLKKLNQLNKKRKSIAKRYSSELNVVSKMPYSKNCSYHYYWICVKNRSKFMEKMKKLGIETGIHYKPVHKMTYFKSKIVLPVTDKIEKSIVSIPTHPNLTNKHVDKIINSINNYF